MARQVETIEINGKEILVKELKASEVRDVVRQLEDPEYKTPFFDDLYPETLPSNCYTIITGLTAEELEEYTPSELQPLFKAAERLNKSFMGLQDRKKKMADKITENLPPEVLAELLKRGQTH